MNDALQGLTSPVNVRRTTGGFAWVGGRPAQGGYETIVIQASAQQASDHDLQSLPEGQRSTEIMKFYTETELLVTDDKADPPIVADVIEHRGSLYKVIRRYTADQEILDYYKVMASRVGKI